MIPDHLIDKAAAAIYASSVFGDKFAYDAWHDLDDDNQIKITTRALARAALEAVAADIWEQGADAGEEIGYGIAQDNWAPRITNALPGVGGSVSTINPRDIECDGCGQPAGKPCLTGTPSTPEQNRTRTGTHLARRADAYWETLRTNARDAPAGTPLADAYEAALSNEYLARGAIAPFIAGLLYAQAQNNQETA